MAPRLQRAVHVGPQIPRVLDTGQRDERDLTNERERGLERDAHAIPRATRAADHDALTIAA